MTDEEAIKRAWYRLDPTLRTRVVEYGDVVRAVPPLSLAPMSAAENGLAASKDAIDVIEYAAGPFCTIVGRWRDVVTLV